MLKRPSEYMGNYVVLSSRSPLADFDALQHWHGRFESLVSGTLVVEGKTVEFADLPLMGLLALAPAKYPVGQPCSADDHLVAMMMMVVVAFVESPSLDWGNDLTPSWTKLQYSFEYVNPLTPGHLRSSGSMDSYLQLSLVLAASPHNRPL